MFLSKADRPQDLDVKKALDELQDRNLIDIHRATAYTWAARAVAACQLGLHEDEIDYRHEALEHAASTMDNGKLVSELQDQTNCKKK